MPTEENIAVVFAATASLCACPEPVLANRRIADLKTHQTRVCLSGFLSSNRFEFYVYILINSVDVARACICVLEAGAEAGGVGLNIASAEAPTWVRKTPFSSQFILKLVIFKTKTGSGQA